MKTETEITSSRFPRIWIALATVAVIALVAAFFLDHAAAAWIGAHSSPELKRAMQTVSRVGDWPAHVIAGLLGIAIAFVMKSKTWMRIFLAMLVALALAGVTGRVVKLATGRARPQLKQKRTGTAHGSAPSITLFPRSHRLLHSFFCCTVSQTKRDRRPAVADSGSDRALPHGRRRSLLIRCRLRRDPWGNLRRLSSSVALDSRFVANQSLLTNHFLRRRRGWDSNPRGLAPCRFSRPEPSTTRPPLRVRAR